MRAESYVTYRSLVPEHLAVHTAFLETAAGKAYIVAFWRAQAQSYRQAVGQAAKISKYPSRGDTSEPKGRGR